MCVLKIQNFAKMSTSFLDITLYCSKKIDCNQYSYKSLFFIFRTLFKINFFLIEFLFKIDEKKQLKIGQVFFEFNFQFIFFKALFEYIFNILMQ